MHPDNIAGLAQKQCEDITINKNNSSEKDDQKVKNENEDKIKDNIQEKNGKE